MDGVKLNKQTKEERMQLIRDTAKRFKQKQAREARFIREEKQAEKDRKKEKASNMASEIYWTDATKYANEYYGEVYHQTTKFDNDWN